MNDSQAEFWARAAEGGLSAAKVLMQGGSAHARSAVSRAYYAAFSAVTAALLQAGHRPRHRLGTWSHADLPRVAQAGLVQRLGFGRCKDVKSRLEVGYKMRVAADYEVGLSVDDETARRAVSGASAILKVLEYAA